MMKPCPCGSGLLYAECCEPYITGAADPPTAEALMRSRYSAYVEHAVGYILETCLKQGERDIDEKATRDWSQKSTWRGLRILSVSKGQREDTEGTVEFEARYEQEGREEVHHEAGRFKKQNGRWWYEDGKVIPHTVVRATPKVGRNEPCPCGSGKKYKHCCGKSA
jgi:SEC-C motif-containing protein